MTSEDVIEAGEPLDGKKSPRNLFDTVRWIVTLAIFALLLRSLIVAPFFIPSSSMLPRMMVGDYLFVAKWSYGYSRYSFPFGIIPIEGRILGGTPRRGDVVVFRVPGTNDDYVKRLIGLPGDQIQMRGGVLHINGSAVPKVRVADFTVPVSPNSPCPNANKPMVRVIEGPGGERLCAYPRFRETLPEGRSYEVLDEGDHELDNTAVYLVPEGHYFMMGDNRDDSEDSRVPRLAGGVDMLPEDHLIGPALVTFFSTDGSASWVKPWTWFSATRWDRIGGTY